MYRALLGYSEKFLLAPCCNRRGKGFAGALPHKKNWVKRGADDLRMEADRSGQHRREIATVAARAKSLTGELDSDDADQGADDATAAAGYEYRDRFGGLRLAETCQPPHGRVPIDLRIALAGMLDDYNCASESRRGPRSSPGISRDEP